MSIFHDEIEIEDFEYCEEEDLYTYPCPCGDEFIITREELMDGLEEATCPSCSLKVKVIYNKEDFKKEHIEIEEKLGSLTLKETKVCN